VPWRRVRSGLRPPPRTQFFLSLRFLLSALALLADIPGPFRRGRGGACAQRRILGSSEPLRSRSLICRFVVVRRSLAQTGGFRQGEPDAAKRDRAGPAAMPGVFGEVARSQLGRCDRPSRARAAGAVDGYGPRQPSDLKSSRWARDHPQRSRPHRYPRSLR
jgi:hypothetical protein